MRPAIIEGKGALIAHDNTLHFAEKVHQLLMNPEHRYELGKQAQAYALAKWTAKLQAERMIEFYEQQKLSKAAAEDYFLQVSI